MRPVPDAIAEIARPSEVIPTVWRLEGREYAVQEGDVLHFRFGV